MKNRLRLLGLILLLAAPLVFILRGFARDVIVVQILRVLWVWRIFFASIPQLPFWALFLVIMAFIAGSSLVRGKKPRRARRRVGMSHQGQVQTLARWIRHVDQGDYFQRRLAQHLGALMVETLAHRERISPRQMRQYLESSRPEVPPEIQACLQAGLRPVSSRYVGLFATLRRRWLSDVPDLPSDFDRVVQFLEDQLEIGGST